MHKNHCLNHYLPKAIFIAIFMALAVSRVSAQAANTPFSEATIRLDNMRANQANIRILVMVKTGTTATEDHLRIIFGDTMAVNATAGNITTAVANIPPSHQGEALTPWPTIGATAAARGTVPCSYNSSLTCFAVDFTSGDLTPNTLYGFFITSGISTPVGAGQQQHTIMSWDDASGGTYDLGEEVDTSKVATRIIADNQVVVTAVVPPNLTFSLNRNTTTYVDDPNNDNAIGAGGPNPIDVDPTGYVTSQRVLASIGTNAFRGWSLWLMSANQSLDSALTSESIPTQGTINAAPTTLVAGNDYYQLETRVHTDSVTASTGTVTIPAEYDDPTDADVTSTSTAKAGGTFGADFQEIAYADGKTDGDIISIYSHVTTNTMRAAATDYTDVWDVIACANF